MAGERLSDQEIDVVVGLLTGWKDKLTWALLVVHVEAILRRPFSRQGLDKHYKIVSAFRDAKDRQRTKTGKAVRHDDEHLPPELATALRRVENLLAEIQVMKAERARFLETFAVWQYNARSGGISEQRLNMPLPVIDRDASEKK